MQSLYRLTSLPKPQPSDWGNRCSSSFGCFSFRWKETGVEKRQFVLLEICNALSSKPGHFSLNRTLLNGYFIVKWRCYIYRLLDCHFKRFYWYNLNIADIFWTHQFQLGLSYSSHQVSYAFFNYLWSNLGITMSSFLKLYCLS